jgi:hypothetical protein
MATYCEHDVWADHDVFTDYYARFATIENSTRTDLGVKSDLDDTPECFKYGEITYFDIEPELNIFFTKQFCRPCHFRVMT